MCYQLSLQNYKIHFTTPYLIYLITAICVIIPSLVVRLDSDFFINKYHQAFLHFCGSFRRQRIARAKVQEGSAISGLLLQKCRVFPLVADCSRESAGRFRCQRNAVALLQGVSADSGSSRKSAGRFHRVEKA